MKVRTQRFVAGAAGLWLAFVVAHWALNGRWWLWLVPASAPPLVFTVIPALVLVFARSRISVALALGGLLLGLPYNGLSVHFNRPHSAQVRVFSWNTEFWDQDDDPDGFYRYLHRQSADVYLLQEYIGWNHERPFDGQLPMDDLVRLRAEFPGYQVIVRGELVTLSRFAVVAQPPVAPDPAARGDSTTDFEALFRDARVLRTDLRVGDSTVSFYNAHIAVQIRMVDPFSASFWNVPHEADPRRRQELTGLWTDIEGNANPVVLAGDFNTSPAMADLDGVPDRLHDANRFVAPLSWPASLPLWRLDWAFSSLYVDDYELHSPEGLSDHRSQTFAVG